MISTINGARLPLIIDRNAAAATALARDGVLGLDHQIDGDRRQPAHPMRLLRQTILECAVAGRKAVKTKLYKYLRYLTNLVAPNIGTHSYPFRSPLSRSMRILLYCRDTKGISTRQKNSKKLG